MKTLKELLKSGKPIVQIIRELKGEKVSIEDLLRGGTSHEEVKELLGPALDLEAFGEGELGGRIIVIEPSTDLLDERGRPVRLYYVIGTGDISITNEQPGARPFYERKEMEQLIPIDLTDIIIENGTLKVKRKKKEITNPEDPHKGKGLTPGKTTTKRRVAQYDVLLYNYLRNSGEDIAHLIHGLEELDEEKKAITGEEAIRRKFPEADSLLAFGVTAVHSLESWLREMVDERIGRLRRDIKDFYITEEGKTFVRDFLSAGFTDYDQAPDVVQWVIKNRIPKRDTQFLLSAVGAGMLQEETEKKLMYTFWGRVARCTRQAASNKFLIENGYLNERRKVTEVMIPILREYRSRRGIYSGASVESTFLGMYGLGLMLDSKGEAIGAHTINRSYVIPARYFINNYPTIRGLVEEILAETERWKEAFPNCDRTSGLIQKVILETPELKGRLTTNRVGSGKIEKVPLSEHTLRTIIPLFFKIEAETYMGRTTYNRDKNLFTADSE